MEPNNQFQMTLVKIETLSPSICSFFFEAVPQFTFEPGQFLEWTIPHPNPDSRGTKRWFTLASSPTEKLIQLTTRFADQGSSFKTALQNKKIGDHIWAHGVEGDFNLPDDKRAPLVFIAGGIGITPFRSMVKYLLDTNEKRDVILLYAAKSPADLIFLDLFEKARTVLSLKLVTIVSQPTAEWTGNSGTVDRNFISNEIPNIASAQVYVSGPEPMVETLSGTLRSIGVANNSIHQDFFPGYLASIVSTGSPNEQ